MSETVNPFLDFGGKWVVVTGATSGIGKAAALELNRNGANVILVGRDASRLSETADQMRDNSHETLELDLSDLDLIGPELLKLVKKVGRIYGLCHGAGNVSTRPLSSNKPEIVQSMMTVNTFAGLELARTVARRDVIEEGGGSLLFISSIYGRVGVPGQIGYSASKGAITSAMRAMAVELSRRNVRVNAISPGLVSTHMTEEAFKLLSNEQVEAIKGRHPLGPGTPEDIAGAVVFLMAPSTSWITGVDLAVDGGYSAQ